MTIQNPNKLFPLFLTSRLEETKRYYLEKACFRVVVESAAYLQLAHGGEDGPELCFMAPDGFPDGKPRPAFDGKGVVVSIPTPNADAKALDMLKRGAEHLTAVEDKPWGWRSFLTVDPNGLILDFFHVYKEYSPM